MARQARNAKIDSRTAREKLPMQHEPYWHKAGHALHLGYRKGSDKGSSWLARGYDGTRYHKTTLGRPDDRQDADGTKVLSFTQAVQAAHTWWTHRTDEVAPPAPPVTVRSAAKAYVADYVARGGKDLRSVESRIRLHVLPTFSDVEIVELTKPQIEQWLYALAAAPRLHRPSKVTGVSKAAAHDATDPAAVRRRQSAANRTLTVLKAILNHAFSRHDAITSDKAWGTVKAFKEVDAARERSLTPAEVKALLAATTGAFRDLVQAALLTGCRYSELAAFTVADFSAKRCAVHVGRSKSGKARDVALTAPAVALFGRVAKDRKPKERVFLRKDGEPWRASDQLRPMRAACKIAGIEPAVGFHILRHTHASELVMRGVSLQVVAKQIGHIGTRTTERHYTHLQPSFIAEQINAALPDFSLKED